MFYKDKQLKDGHLRSNIIIYYLINTFMKG